MSPKYYFLWEQRQVTGCGYSLEAHDLGTSNECLHCMFFIEK